MKVARMNEYPNGVEVTQAGSAVTDGEFMPRYTDNDEGARVYDSPPYVDPYCKIIRTDGERCRNIPHAGQDRCFGHMGRGAK